MNTRGLIPFGALVVSSLFLGGSAQADAAGDKYLAAVEAVMNNYKTMTIEYDAIDQAPGKAERKLVLAVKIKGEKRMTEFLAPADMKGTKVLILSPTQMYVYLPAFGKVRRIASHVTDQGFMGMTYSQDDFTTHFASDYSAAVTSETAGEAKLTLTAKGAEAPYGRIEMTITKDKKLPTELKYFNRTGTHIKTETRTNYECENGACTAQVQTMVDHTKGGHSTKLVRTKWQVNPSLSDSQFSKRSLEK